MYQELITLQAAAVVGNIQVEQMVQVVMAAAPLVLVLEQQ
jgi:hypothetical protein